MSKAQIKHMVDRFLGWKLPENFNPDGGISFKATFNEHTAHPMKHQPSGTNLFDATQADAMVRYMVEGMPADTADLEAQCLRSLLASTLPALERDHAMSRGGPTKSKRLALLKAVREMTQPSRAI